MTGRRSPWWWEDLPSQQLLDVRLRDLRVRIPGSVLEPRVQRLFWEFEKRGLRFRPYVWLSTGWFTPHDLTGFAIPFFLAHPRLARLERQQMLEVEGSTRDSCMKLLRHEAGHAIDNAYRLYRRKAWRQHFGRRSDPYTSTYVPRPSSRRYVQNLDNWYAQSHPLEDFAETFAVWLQPRSAWRTRYAQWPALRKLEYVDELMGEIAGDKPSLRSREHVDALSRLPITLREYYRRKKARYGVEDRSIYDRDLRRLFSDDPRHRHRKRASTFLRSSRTELRRQISSWTGQVPFVVDQVLKDMMLRCRDLRLHLCLSERETGEGAAVLVTVHVVRLMRRRYHEYYR